MQSPLSLEVSSSLLHRILCPSGPCSLLQTPLSSQVCSISPHCISSPRWSQKSPVISLVSTGLQQSASLCFKSPVVSAVSCSLRCLFWSLAVYLTVFQVQVVIVVACILYSFYRSLAVYLIVVKVNIVPCSLLWSYLSLQVSSSIAHCISNPQPSLQSLVVSLVSRGLYQSTSLYFKSPVVREVSLVSRGLQLSTRLCSKSQLSLQSTKVSIVPTGLKQSHSLYFNFPVVPAVPMFLEVSRSLPHCILSPSGPCSLLQSPLSLQISSSLCHCISNPHTFLQSPLVCLVSTGPQQSTSLYLKIRIVPEVSLVFLQVSSSQPHCSLSPRNP